jgi:hypothetical protein
MLELGFVSNPLIYKDNLNIEGRLRFQETHPKYEILYKLRLF